MPVLLTMLDGKTVCIREAAAGDGTAILEFANTLFESTDMVLTQPQEFKFTQAQEEEMIKEHAERADALLMVATAGCKVVGLMNFSCNRKLKINHWGELGISVLPAYHKNGIGKAMLGALITWAAEISQIEKLCLNVFHTNAPAIRLYKSLGFIAEGRQKKAVRQPDGSYVDMITMSYFK